MAFIFKVSNYMDFPPFDLFCSVPGNAIWDSLSFLNQCLGFAKYPHLASLLAAKRIDALFFVPLCTT